MSAPKLNKPHALYYNGELVAVVTNPDPFCGGVDGLVNALNEHSETRGCGPREIAKAREIPQTMDNLDAWSKFCQGVLELGIDGDW